MKRKPATFKDLLHTVSLLEPCVLGMANPLSLFEELQMSGFALNGRELPCCVELWTPFTFIPINLNFIQPHFPGFFSLSLRSWLSLHWCCFCSMFSGLLHCPPLLWCLGFCALPPRSPWLSCSWIPHEGPIETLTTDKVPTPEVALPHLLSTCCAWH